MIASNIITHSPVKRYFSISKAIFKTTSITNVTKTIVGGGTMSSCAAAAKYEVADKVTLADFNENVLKNTRNSIEKNLKRILENKYKDDHSKGDRFVGEILSRISFVEDVHTRKRVRDIHLTIESIVEDLGIKQEFFNDLDKVAPKKIIFLSKSSFLMCDQIGNGSFSACFKRFPKTSKSFTAENYGAPAIVRTMVKNGKLGQKLEGCYRYNQNRYKHDKIRMTRGGAKILSDNEIRQLPKILSKFLPQSAIPHNIALLHLQNRHNQKHLKAKFYICSPSIETEPIFLVSILEKTYEETEISVFTSDSSGITEDTLEIFEKLVNWTQLNTFITIIKPLTEKIREMCNRHGKVSVVPCKLKFMKQCYKIDGTYLQKQEKLQSENKRIRVGPVRREDVKFITTIWKYAKDGSKIEIVDLIDRIASAGVYVDSELVCWIFLTQIGSLGLLHTLEQHRGKGYAEIVSRNITKTSKDMGLIPLMEMEADNIRSSKLFSKIGYDFGCDEEWIYYSPR